MIYTLEEFSKISHFCYCGLAASIYYINKYNSQDLKYRCNKHSLEIFEDAYSEYVEISEEELVCLRVMES